MSQSIFDGIKRVTWICPPNYISTITGVQAILRHENKYQVRYLNGNRKELVSTVAIAGMNFLDILKALGL